MKSRKIQFEKTIVTFAIVCIGGLVLLILRRVYAAKNYPKSNYPVFSGNFAFEEQEPINELTVVSYNIRYSQNIERAIAELTDLRSQKGLDLILLQEVNEAGVKQIALALKFNFVYIPAAIEPRYHQNTGNAVLSRWPITDSEKLILPHNGLSSGMNRTATKAIVSFQGTDILVYSIHAETKFTWPRFQEDQYKTILEDVDHEAAFVIIGGDFNSVTARDVVGIEDIYEADGFVRATNNSGHTVVKFQVTAVADHIFSKGFCVMEDGKIEQATASDHLPIWVRLGLQ